MWNITVCRTVSVPRTTGIGCLCKHLLSRVMEAPSRLKYLLYCLYKLPVESQFGIMTKTCHGNNKKETNKQPRPQRSGLRGLPSSTTEQRKGG